MEKYNSLAKFTAILGSIIFLLSFGLLNYHYSFNPYTWLDSTKEDDFSRSLWLERRNSYAYLVAISFGTSSIAIAYLFLSWVIQKKNRIILK